MIDPTLLHAYVDGEATPDERKLVEDAAKSSDAIATEIQSIKAMKAFVAENATPIPDEDLWKSSVSRLDEIDKTKRIEGFVGRYAWGLCAVFFFVILAGGMITRNSRSTVRTGEVARYVSGLAQLPGLDNASLSGVRQWLGQQAPAVQNTINPERLRVVGAVSGIIDRRRVSQLNLKDDLGEMALVIVQDAQSVEGVEKMSGSGAFGRGTIGDVNCVAWSLNGCSLLLIGDRSHEDLRQIAQAIRLR